MGATAPKEEKSSNSSPTYINIISINNNGTSFQSSTNDISKLAFQDNEVKEGDAAPVQPSKNIYENINNNDSFKLNINNGSFNNEICISKNGKNIFINGQNQNFKINENNSNNQSNIAINENNNNIQSNIPKNENNHIINEVKNIVKENLKDEIQEIYNKPIKGGIDPNIGGNERISEKKETTKSSEINKEYNPIFGKEGQKDHLEEEKNIKENTKKGNIDINISGKYRLEEEADKKENNKKGNIDINQSGNYRLEEEVGKNTGTFGNPDEDKIKELKKELNKQPIEIRYQQYDDDDLELSQSVLTASFSNLNLNDPNDKQLFMEDVIKKVNEGYFPLFLEIDNRKKCFYYVKNDSTLKSALNLYIKQNGITREGNNYTLYNQGEIVDQDTLIGNLGLKAFAIIANHPK